MLSGEGDDGTEPTRSDVHLVESGSFNIVIPVSGELAAVRQVEIRNQLESRSVITEILDEGTQVRKGDVVVRLADDEIRQRILDAEDKVKNAQSDLIAAEQNLEIKRSARESELEKADLAIELATLALQAWEEGEVVKKREELALAEPRSSASHEGRFPPRSTPIASSSGSRRPPDSSSRSS